jgi:tRNA-dihydrouridine synthase A
LSPKQNREIPPLDYARVYRLKRELPALRIVINGGFTTLEDSVAQLTHVDGVMVGRAAYQDSWLLARLDETLFGGPAAGEAAVLEAFERYAARELARGTPLRAMTRHLLGMRSGRAGGRRWRRDLAALGDGASGLAKLRTLVEAAVAMDCGAPQLQQRIAAVTIDRGAPQLQERAPTPERAAASAA